MAPLQQKRSVYEIVKHQFIEPRENALLFLLIAERYRPYSLFSFTLLCRGHVEGDDTVVSPAVQGAEGLFQSFLQFIFLPPELQG